MKLYFHPMSGNAHRVVSFLATHQIPFEPHIVALQEGAHKRPEFLAMNPMGQVPVLVDNDLTLSESVAILRYLATHHAPEALGSTPTAQAHVDQWCMWGVAQLGPALSELNAASGLARMFGRTPDEAIIAQRVEAIHALLAILKPRLDAHAFIVGSSPTIADYTNACLLEATMRFSPELTLDDPTLHAWLTRMTSLEHWPKG